MKYFTLREIATLNNVSKSTIQWQLKKIENQKGKEYIENNTTNTDNNCLCLNEILTQEIEQRLNNRAGNEKNKDIQSENDTQKIDLLNEQINFLKEQIQTKDLQIQQLSDQLTDAMSALKASQSIQAMYMKQIEEKEEQQQEQHETENRKASFFKRIFRKNEVN